MTERYNPALKEPLVTSSGTTPTWWSRLGNWERQTIQGLDVGTPMWWLLRGIARLEAERPDLLKFEQYWQGDHPLPDTIDRETQEKYRAIVAEARSNYMRTVVEVISERLHVQGLWIPGDDERADSETWEIWEANGLDAWQTVAFAEMVAKRRSYWSVWYPESGTTPRIEIEDPLQTWVELVPGSRTERAAAVKTWVDDWTGDVMADVLLPDSLHFFIQEQGRWVERQKSQPNRLGEVPVVPMVNRPTLRGAEVGFSEIEDVIPIQDRLNRTTLGRMLVGHTAAFRQKWATGIEVPEDEDGNPLSPFKPGVTDLWVSEDPNAKFGQFDASEVRNYTIGEEQDLQHIANITRMPRHYFNPTGQAPSGDSIHSAEAGLDAKILRMQSFSAGPIKTVLRLARAVAGLDTPMASEIVWADTEFQSFGQLVDGTVKLVQDGIASKAWARERIGMSPATMRRVQAEILSDQFMATMTTAGDPTTEQAPAADEVDDAAPVA
jgi:hypothetical protein